MDFRANHLVKWKVSRYYESLLALLLIILYWCCHLRLSLSPQLLMLKLSLPVFLGTHLLYHWFDMSPCFLTTLKKIARWLRPSSPADNICSLDVVRGFSANKNKKISN